MSRTDFGSHTYWRVYGAEDNACLQAGFVAYSEMAFKDSSGSAITLTGSAIESNHFSTFAAANLFDGNDTTFFESTSAIVPWCGYQFTSPQAVMQIGLKKHASMDGSRPAVLALFEFSDDGITWFTVAMADTAAALNAAGNDTFVYFNFAVAL